MKRILYSVLAIAVLSLAAGCQREEIIGPAEGPAVDVNFQVSLQGLQTKAFSDGTKAKDLYVLVYASRTEGNVLLESVSQDLTGAFTGGLTTTVTLRLIRGESYNIVFWAQAPNAPYTLDKVNGTITVATEGLANDDLRDAFYAVWSQKVEPTGSHSYPVELRRPLAQINVLATAEDFAALEASKIGFAGSSFTMEAPSVLNLVTGEAGTPKTYTFTRNVITEAVDISGYDADKYKYVAMNYVLAGDRVTSNLSFGLYRGTDDLLFDKAVPSVPYQRNWRTLIVGDVFSLEGQFSVTIVPDFLGAEEVPAGPYQYTGTGTQTDPYTVADVFHYIDGLGASGTISADEVYVKGRIASVKYTYSANFGTAIFDIVDKANDNDFFQAYQINYLGNQKWVTGNKWNVSVGDEVVVCGKVTLYVNGSYYTYQTHYKKNEYSAYLYSLNGKTQEE